MNNGPANAVMGEDFGTDLPQTEMPEQDLGSEKAAAKFSRTAEFKRLKQHLEERIEYYQAYLPNGQQVLATGELSMSELGMRWTCANAVITEFKAVIAAYEQAQEVVREAAKRGR